MTISAYTSEAQVLSVAALNHFWRFGSKLWWHTKALATVLGLMGLTIFSLFTLVLCEVLDRLFERIQAGTSCLLKP